MSDIVNTKKVKFHRFFWYFGLPVTILLNLYRIISTLVTLSYDRAQYAYRNDPHYEAMDITLPQLRRTELFSYLEIAFLALLIVLCIVAFIGFFRWKKTAYKAIKAFFLLGIISYLALVLLQGYFYVRLRVLHPEDAAPFIINYLDNYQSAGPTGFFASIVYNIKLFLIQTGIRRFALPIQIEGLLFMIGDSYTFSILRILLFASVVVFDALALRYYSKRKELFAGNAKPVYADRYAEEAAPIRLDSAIPPVGTRPQFCADCGAVLIPGRNFCTQCGSPVRSMAAPPTPPARRSAPTSQNQSGFMSGGEI